MSARALVDVITSLVGSVLVLVALAIIWVARLSINAQIYVSELGAPGMPTARAFEIALLLIVAGGSLIAFAGKDIRSRVRWLAIWTPAVSLWIACGFFAVASQVTCTPGCPLPVNPILDLQDVTHITCATAAFVIASFAMLQSAFSVDHRILARFSLVMAIAVGVVSGIGGLCSLARIDTDFGSRAELIATTLAIAWVVVFGITIAARRVRERRRLIEELRAAEAQRLISSRTRLASPTST